MFSLVVVLDEGEVVESGFDVQDEAEFVVELERDRPHGALDARPFEADVQAVAHLALIAGIELFFIRATSHSRRHFGIMDRLVERRRNVALQRPVCSIVVNITTLGGG